MLAYAPGEPPNAPDHPPASRNAARRTLTDRPVPVGWICQGRPICPSTHRHRAHADRPQRRRVGPWFVRTVTGLAEAPSSTSTRFHSCGPLWRDWRQRLVEVWLGLSSMPFRVRKAAAKSLLMLRLTRLSATRKK